MKNLIIILAIMLGSCSKESEVGIPATGTILFYSTDWHNRWSITIDGDVKGSVGQSSTAPNCGDHNFHNITMEAGSHKLEVTSLSGLASEPPVNVTWPANGCIQYNVK